MRQQVKQSIGPKVSEHAIQIADDLMAQNMLDVPCVVAAKVIEKTLTSDIQWGLQRAKTNGLRIVEPKPNELQLDIDSAAMLIFHEMQWSIFEKAGVTDGWTKKITRSKRGGEHLHITITLPNNIDNLERVCLQTLLGSDLKREAFNFCRVKNGNKYPIVLFEKK